MMPMTPRRLAAVAVRPCTSLCYLCYLRIKTGIGRIELLLALLGRHFSRTCLLLALTMSSLSQVRFSGVLW